MILELVQVCSICNELIHMDLELVQVCCIGSRPIHMVPKLEQACTNLKRDSYLAIYYIVGKRPSKYTLNISPSCTSCTPCGMQAKALTVYNPSMLLLLK